MSRPAPRISATARKVVILAFSDASGALQGVLEWGKTCNWDMIRLEAWHWEMPKPTKPDGLITCLGLEKRHLARALHNRIPKGVAISSLEQRSTVPDIHTDDNAVGEQAAQYYWDRGFRNFAVAAFKKRGWADRLTMFKKSIEEHGSICGSITDLRIDDKGLERAYTIFKEGIHPMKLPLAIFCSNDLLASHVCRWCLRLGLAVPEQVSILGAGNDIMSCECSPIPISSVDTQPIWSGKEAARILQQIMDGAFVPPGRINVPPAGIVTRRSTDITALPNLAEARALRYIWDHFSEDIGAPEVSNACGIQIRTLDRRFTASIGRTVAREIRRRRLLAACDILRTENVKVAEVAAMVGFKTPQHFNYRFKQTFGMTPKQYRAAKRP